MSSNWKIVPKESWRNIVADYSDRIRRIRDMAPWDIGYSEKPTDTIPEKCIFSAEDEQLIKQIIQLLGYFGSSTYFVALQVAQTVLDLWESGQFVVVPLNIRFVFECWGRIHFGSSILHRLIRGGDVKKEYELTERLTFGTRSEIHLPWGGKSSDRKSINIMECVRGLKNIDPDSVNNYDFLSESSHPSFTENSYFQMAGPPLSNWDNKAFEKIAKPLLERCFCILEKSVDGIQKEVFYLVSVSSAIDNLKQ